MGLGEESHGGQEHGAEDRVLGRVQNLVDGHRSRIGSVDRSAPDEVEVRRDQLEYEHINVPRLEAILPEREVALLGKECLWGGSYGGGHGFVALGDEWIFIIMECMYLYDPVYAESGARYLRLDLKFASNFLTSLPFVECPSFFSLSQSVECFPFKENRYQL